MTVPNALNYPVLVAVMASVVFVTFDISLSSVVIPAVARASESSPRARSVSSTFIIGPWSRRCCRWRHSTRSKAPGRTSLAVWSRS